MSEMPDKTYSCMYHEDYVTARHHKQVVADLQAKLEETDKSNCCSLKSISAAVTQFAGGRIKLQRILRTRTRREGSGSKIGGRAEEAGDSYGCWRGDISYTTDATCVRQNSVRSENSLQSSQRGLLRPAPKRHRKGPVMDELKPCPFCGDENPRCYQSEVSDQWHVVCSHCYAKTDNVGTKKIACKRWNTRAAIAEATP